MPLLASDAIVSPLAKQEHTQHGAKGGGSHKISPMRQFCIIKCRSYRRDKQKEEYSAQESAY